MPSRPEYVAYGLGAIGMVCVTVLSALGTPVPDVLSGVTIAAVGGGLGISKSV